MSVSGLRKSEGVAKYVQLASLLRTRISQRVWNVDERLPTVAALAKEHNVALITVRQALHLLSREGLITSEPGRGTHVRSIPTGPGENLRSAINDPNAELKQSQIKVLSREVVTVLPVELQAFGASYASYTWLKKVHLEGGIPFCGMDLYVAQPVFEAFPPRAETKRKIVGLLLEQFPDKLSDLCTRITVVPADYHASTQLEYPFGAPIARMARAMLDKRGRVLYAGIFVYRADRFLLDMSVPIEAMIHQSTLGEPTVK